MAYIELEAAKDAIIQYIAEQTVSKYPSAELCKASRMGAEGVIYELETLPTADVAEVKWIPVTERLPKGRRDYLCIYIFGESDMLFYNVLMFHPEQNAENGYVTGPHFNNEGVGGMRVTHWMPLPKPPCGAKMDGKED